MPRDEPRVVIPGAERALPSRRVQLALLCALALALRVGVYLAWPGRIHPDETFQYIEQAHRLLGGAAIVPWEYQVGVRSWLLPALLALPLGLGRWLSADPLVGVRLVSLGCALISLVAVWAGYRWGERAAGPAGALSAGALNAVAVQLVYFAPHPLADTLVMAPLVAGLLWAEPLAGAPARRLLTAGALLGLAVGLRVQLVPAVACGLVALVMMAGGWRERRNLGLLAGGAGLALLALGLLDWITLGTPFQSLWLYAWLNGQGVAASYGHLPWFAYLSDAGARWGPLFLPLCGLMLLGARRAPVPAAALAATLLALSLIGHKEPRFLAPVLPLAMTLAGIGAAQAAGWFARRHGHAPAPLRLGAGLAVFWMLACLGLGTLWPGQPVWRNGAQTTHAFARINQDPAACGLAIAPANEWSRVAGYAYLRPGIGLYGVSPPGGAAQFAAFNYLFALPGGDFAAQGYTVQDCGNLPPLCLWHRPGACDAAAGHAPDVPARPVLSGSG